MTPSPFSDSDWEMLIAFIQERSVIPVIGAGLSEVLDSTTGKTLNFESWLVGEMALRLNLPKADSLDALVRSHLATGGNTRSLYPLIRNLTLSAPFEPPKALRKLSAIKDFPLFVTTTFDGLLSKALSNENAGFVSDELAYSPKQFDDLPQPVASLAHPAIYYLMGKVAATARYAICDEDILEWISALQSETYAPERLVAEFQNHHLLVIGVNFPDWLGRFFVRTTKRRRLSEDRDCLEFIVSPEGTHDPSLSKFLRSVSRGTYVISNYSDPGEFVEELHARWSAVANPQRRSLNTMEPIRFMPPPREMPPGAVFISYSRGDLEAAKNLKCALDEARVPVWFDMEQLDPGDDYALKIRRNINACSYFIPIISASALKRDEAFFYREWAWALDRRHGMGKGAIFILPLIIDDVPPEHPRIADFAEHCDIAVAHEGKADARFTSRLQELLRVSHATV